ncbi:hypothetical protein [Nocardioides sp.]|uniref:hypothetical protein n=1 Tax=Nocardioides sp. TaxID=35761 RepID=UPI003569AE23
MLLTHLRRNVVAYLALIVALTTGTAYAAGLANGSVTNQKLAKNAVTSPKIKKGSVKRSDLHKKAVTGAVVKDGSLTKSDLAPGTLPEADLFHVVNNGTMPASSPDSSGHLTAQMTMPRAGEIFVRLDAAFTRSCSSGVGRFGLYVDGFPIPGTGNQTPGAGDRYTVTPSALVELSKGLHTFALGLDCPDGDFTGGAFPLSHTWTFLLQGE